MNGAIYMTNADGGCCFCDDPCADRTGHMLGCEIDGMPTLYLVCLTCFTDAMEAEVRS